MRGVMKVSGINQRFAEADNHRSIGKVERIIGFVQSIMQRYNVESGDKLVKDTDKWDRSWLTVESLLPHIQTAINQRRPRFTTYSPNMLMFGTQLNDITDIDRILKGMDIIRNDQNNVVTRTDFDELTNLMVKIKDVNEHFKQDWKNYTWLSKMQYEDKYKISPKKIHHYQNRFKVGSKVLYYMGGQKVTGKWRQKWTGPWTIERKLGDTTTIIVDESTGNQRRVSFNRLKIFSKSDVDTYSRVMGNDDVYNNHRERLLNRLISHPVLPFQNLGENLDFEDDDPAIN